MSRGRILLALTGLVLALAGGFAWGLSFDVRARPDWQGVAAVATFLAVLVALWPIFERRAERHSAAGRLRTKLIVTAKHVGEQLRRWVSEVEADPGHVHALELGDVTHQLIGEVRDLERQFELLTNEEWEPVMYMWNCFRDVHGKNLFNEDLKKAKTTVASTEEVVKLLQDRALLHEAKDEPV